MLRFIINLDKDLARWTNVVHQFDSLDIPIERVSAVNAKLLASDDIAKVRADLKCNSLFPRELSLGEIGCFLSHRLCWQKLVDSDDHWAFIGEDDIALSNDLATFLNKDNWIPDDVHLIQLSFLEKTAFTYIQKKTIALSNSDRSLVCPIYPEPMGTQGYLISREAAQFALDLSQETLPAPVDNFLWTKRFKVAQKYQLYRVSPSLIKEDETLISTIGDSRYQLKRSPFWVRHGLSIEILKLKTKLSRFNGIKHHMFFK